MSKGFFVGMFLLFALCGCSVVSVAGSAVSTTVGVLVDTVDVLTPNLADKP